MLFERDFDAEKQRYEERKAYRQENPLKYSDADMQQIVDEQCAIAQEEGYRQGFEAGKKDMEDSIMQASFQTLEAMRPQVAEFLAGAEEYRELVEREALEFIVALVKKVVPDVLDEFSIVRIKEMMSKSINMALGSDWIEFRMNSEVKEFLEEDIVQLLSMTGYQGSYDIKAIDEMSSKEAEVSWENGKSEIDLNEIKDNICELVNNAIK